MHSTSIPECLTQHNIEPNEVKVPSLTVILSSYNMLMKSMQYTVYCSFHFTYSLLPLITTLYPSYTIYSELLWRNVSMSTCSLVRLALFLVTMFPAAENRRSEGVDVAGAAK